MNDFLQVLGSFLTPGSELSQIVAVTLKTATWSTLISCAVGIPLGVLIGMREFHGKHVLMRILNTLMGLPPVLAGLLTFFLLSRSGPLGEYQLIYTMWAMVIAQILIITPIVMGLAATATTRIATQVHETVRGVGIGPGREMLLLLYENRTALFSLLFVGFGRAIGEVGAAMLVGGNIQYKTRVMTTAILLETNKGNFTYAVALGVLLLAVSFIINTIALTFEEVSHRNLSRRRSRKKLGA